MKTITLSILQFNTFIKNILDKIPKFTAKAPLEDWFMMLQLSKYTKFKYINKI